MAVSFTHLSWWLWSGKSHHREPPRISRPLSSTAPEPSTAAATRDSRLPLRSRRGRRGEPRRRKEVDREHDVVIVPSDGGVCVSGSGSESDDSDWSIGWLEPHGPGFRCDEGSAEDNSFAVIVPCYGGGGRREMNGTEKSNIFAGIYSAESKRNMEEWLSSLQKS